MLRGCYEETTPVEFKLVTTGADGASWGLRSNDGGRSLLHDEPSVACDPHIIIKK